MPRFVIHKHNATHLHWDLRLELDKVLKSWAIPKEPSMVPGMKRLAVQVNDHPLSYINFSGIIPEDSYGAGKVIIWDKGGFDVISRKDSKLVITMHGSKLKGDFALLNFKGKNWLFFKMKESAAGQEKAVKNIKLANKRHNK